jgi:hypothetical protein
MPALVMSVTASVPAMPRADAPAEGPEDVQQAKLTDLEASKKELLKRMDVLEAKLPQELARRLIILSMKIATGWCSPYLAKEFEAEVDKLPDQERKRFEKEWKAVREHDAWPCVLARKKSGSSSPKK